MWEKKENAVLAVKKRRSEVTREARGPSRPVKKDLGFRSEGNGEPRKGFEHNHGKHHSGSLVGEQTLEG